MDHGNKLGIMKELIHDLRWNSQKIAYLKGNSIFIEPHSQLSVTNRKGDLWEDPSNGGTRLLTDHWV
jgi:hypothetical protein